MLQKSATVLKKLVIVLLIIATVIGGLVYWLFFDINRLPKGELIDQIQSPTGEFNLNIYLVNGGATVSYAIRGELEFKTSSKKPKNIYWSYREETANVKWLDDFTVDINGHIIDVRNQVYDWRRNKN